MERYREYKDSGVQWLREIPRHWKEERAKYLYKKEQRPIEDGDEIVTCFRDGEVTLRRNRRTTGFTEATDYSHYQHICKGDLVIHQMDAFAGSSGVSDSDGMGTPVLSVCTGLTEKTNNYYFAHILRLMGWNGYILSLYRGIRERSSDFRFDTFSKLWLPLPPLSEQHAIVSYLDDKCGKIDKMLEGKQKQIELLAEMKQRIIADAVTRGLNPDVKMKATNIPWLPEIPEHWTVKPIRAILRENNEKSETGTEELLSLSQYTGVSRKKDAGKTGMFEAENTIGYKKVHPGQFVMNIMLAWNGSYAVSGLEGIISPAYCVFDFISNDNKMYYNYLWRLSVYQGAFKTESRGIIDSRLRLYPNKFLPFPTICPPLDEQDSIVSYITKKTSKIDTLTSKLQQEIESIKEYKQRLISDVVTGQIKVC